MKGKLVWFSVLIVTGCSQMPTTPTAISAEPTARVGLGDALSLQIMPETDILSLGQAVAFSVSVRLAEGMPPSGPSPQWSSSDSAVVSVSSDGIARGVSTGDVILSVAFKGRGASRRVTVVP